MKKISKKSEQSQADAITVLFAELDEDILALGPRLFDDRFYDNSKALIERRNYDKGTGQKDKTQKPCSGD